MQLIISFDFEHQFRLFFTVDHDVWFTSPAEHGDDDRVGDHDNDEQCRHQDPVNLQRGLLIPSEIDQNVKLAELVAI